VHGPCPADGSHNRPIMRTAVRSDAPGPRREAVSTARCVLTSVEDQCDARTVTGDAGVGTRKVGTSAMHPTRVRMESKVLYGHKGGEKVEA
jgi:hypothetical protein